MIRIAEALITRPGAEVEKLADDVRLRRRAEVVREGRDLARIALGAKGRLE